MVDLNETVSEMERIFKVVVGDQVSLRTSLDPGLGSIAGDKRKISSVVVNLFLAARDATPAGGELHVATSILELEGPAAEQWRLAPGRYVELRIETRHEIQIKKVAEILGDTGAAVMARKERDLFVIAIAWPHF